MVTELLLLPPAPVQASVYVVLAVSGPTPWEPEIDFVPDHPPEAEQDVAFVEDQLSVDVPLVVTVDGLAESETVTGSGTEDTVMVSELFLLPPAPVQASVYVVLAVSGPTPWEPEIDFVPDHPPEAEQDVAFVEDQLRVDVPLVVTVDGLAESETVGAPGVGAGVGVGVTDDAAPVLVLTSPAPPPQPAVNAENNTRRKTNDTDCEIRGLRAAFPACAMYMFSCNPSLSPNNVHAWTALTSAPASSGNLRAL
jgi:hypothetical protein